MKVVVSHPCRWAREWRARPGFTGVEMMTFPEDGVLTLFSSSNGKGTFFLMQPIWPNLTCIIGLITVLVQDDSQIPSRDVRVGTDKSDFSLLHRGDSPGRIEAKSLRTQIKCSQSKPPADSRAGERK